MSDNPLKPKTLIPSPINPTGDNPASDIEAGKKRVVIAEEIEWLSRLTGNEDFQRFVEIIKSQSMASRKKIGAVESITELSAEQRAAYGQKLVMQLDMADWAEARLTYCMEAIKTLDARAVQS